MNKLLKSLTLLVATSVFAGFAVDLFAQERNRGEDRERGDRGSRRGNWDRSEFMERIMDRYRENLEFSIAEWKVVKPKVQAVMENRISGMSGMFSGFGSGRSRGRDRDSNAEKTPSSELRDALEKNASKEEIQKKLAAHRADLKAKEAKLKKAQGSLRELLSVKQEAQAVLMGLLK